MRADIRYAHCNRGFRKLRRAVRCAAAAALLGTLAGAAPALGAEARRVRLSSPDEVVEITAAVRHTTVIALPEGERILDFVAGDTESWGLAGEGNVSYLKPYVKGAQTNLALVTESGRIFAFLCREGGGEPDLVVHVELGPEDGGEPPRTGSPVQAPAFVAAGEVDAYRDAARDALEEARLAREEAAAAVEEQVEAFRAAYPAAMRFPYELGPPARRDPFSVTAMWTDGRHTYLRSSAPESPAIYEERDGKPSLVEYELTADGLYVTQRMLRGGWLQVGKLRATWRWRPGPQAAGALP